VAFRAGNSACARWPWRARTSAGGRAPGHRRGGRGNKTVSRAAHPPRRLTDSDRIQSPLALQPSFGLMSLALRSRRQTLPHWCARYPACWQSAHVTQCASGEEGERMRSFQLNQSPMVTGELKPNQLLGCTRSAFRFAGTTLLHAAFRSAFITSARTASHGATAQGSSRHHRRGQGF